MSEIERIKKAVFTQTGEKLDSYSLSIIQGIILANQASGKRHEVANKKVVQSNQEILEKFRNTIKTNQYDLRDSSAWQLFIFKNSWGLLLTVALFLGGLMYLGYEFIQKYESSPNPIEFEVIEKQDDGTYGIHKDNYKVVKDGIILNPAK